jgi:hypothetical protein
MAEKAGGQKGPVARAFGSTPVVTALLTVVSTALLGTFLAVVASTNAALGVGVALLGTLIVMVFELTRRFEERVEAEDHRSVLLAAVDDEPMLMTGIREIATNARSALDDDENAELYRALIKVKIDEARLFMQDLSRGRVRVPVDVVTPMGNQIDRVRKNVRATTIPKVDNEWWLSPGGREYLEKNKEAIEDPERKVTIVRIILWEKRDDTEELVTVVREQREAGVHVLFAERRAIKETRLKTNMAIYDELSYNDVVFNSDGEGIYVEYYLEPSDAEQATARFEQLRGLAKKEVPARLPGLKKALAVLDEQEASRLKGRSETFEGEVNREEPDQADRRPST